MLQQLRIYGDLTYKISRASLLINFMIGTFQRDALFVHVPKTAGSSLREQLNIRMLKSPLQVLRQFPNRGRITFAHIAIDHLLEHGFISQSFYQRAFKFAFVREPFARAVSLFQYLKKIYLVPNDMSFLTFCRILRDDGVPPVGLYNFHGLSHCNCQTSWIDPIELDYLGRFERLEEGVRHIALQIGVPPPSDLVHVNASPIAHHRSFYCAETEDIVREFYRRDFTAFDYPTEL